MYRCIAIGISLFFWRFGIGVFSAEITDALLYFLDNNYYPQEKVKSWNLYFLYTHELVSCRFQGSIIILWVETSSYEFDFVFRNDIDLLELVI